MVHMSYVPRDSSRPRINTHVSPRPQPFEIGSEVGAAARDTEEGIRLGTAHVEDAEATEATTRRTRRGNGRVRLRRRAPHRTALRHHLVRSDPGGAVHHHSGGGRRRTGWDRGIVPRGFDRSALHDVCLYGERGAGRDGCWVDGQGNVRYRQHHDHVRLDRTTLPVQPEQRVPDGHRQLLLTTRARCSPNCREWASSHPRRSRRATPCRSRPRAPKCRGSTLCRGLRSEQARDERGATLVLVAVCMVLLLWGGAFGVDLGLTVVGGRQTQAIADTAALDLARYINVADWTTTLNERVAHHQLSSTARWPTPTTDNNSNAALTETPACG